MRAFLVLLLMGALGGCRVHGGTLTQQVVEAPMDGGSAGTPGDGPGLARNPGPGTCGNGVVEGLEACDDGNRDNFDGCSSTCVLEGGARPAVARLGVQQSLPVKMTVTEGGVIFVGNGRSFARVDPDGTVTSAAYQAPGPDAAYANPFLARGDRLLIGRRDVLSAWAFPVAVAIDAWDPSTGLVETLREDTFVEPIATPAWWYGTGLGLGLAAAQDGSATYYSVGGHVRALDGASASTVAWSEPAMVFDGRPVYDDAGRRLLALADNLRDILTFDGNGRASVVGTLPEGRARDVAVDGSGRVFVVCGEAGDPVLDSCPSASVWAAAADGSEWRPFVNPFRDVLAVAYDRAADALVYLSFDGGVYRASLAQPAQEGPPPLGGGPPATTCGDGVVGGLEACDDGNRDDFDGCSADCVLEGERLPTFARVQPLQVFAVLGEPMSELAVTDTGVVVVKQMTGGIDPLLAEVDPHGLVTTPGFATALEPGYQDAGFVGAGGAVYLARWAQGSPGAVDLAVDRWDIAAQMLTTVHYEATELPRLQPYLALAMPRDASAMYFGLDGVRVTTSAATSALVWRDPVLTSYGPRPFYDDASHRLLAIASDCVSLVQFDDAWQPHFLVSLPEGFITTAAVDGVGRLLIGCVACTSAAVWIAAPDGS
ncbi:MAG TPA: DUF4215 domain-containing protein, partial [Polyangia bacterium]